MHSLAALIVEKPQHADELLTRFQERWDTDSNYGYWDWWAHGGRWSTGLEEDGCVEDNDGYYVLSLAKAREWKPPIVGTPHGHVFDSDQLTYEVSHSPAWDAVRDSIFDEFTQRHGEYVAVMVDVHS